MAIAKKNAVKLLSSDNLHGIDHDRLIAMKSGGQTLGQLTEFCRELARKGITDEFSDDDLNGDEDDFHHPFLVKDKPLPSVLTSAYPGSSLARDGVALEYLTPAMRSAAKTHRMLEFPVSSGNAHRVKEKDEPEPEQQQKDEKVEEEEAEKVGTYNSTVESRFSEWPPSAHFDSLNEPLR